MNRKIDRFKSLSLHERFRYLRKNGRYLESRYFGAYRVHLYEAEGFFTEVWMRPDLDQVCWIEVADPRQVAENYTRDFDLKKSLGL